MQSPSIAKNFELLSEAFQVTNLKAEEIEFWRSGFWDADDGSNYSNALVDSFVRHGEFSLLADVCWEHLEYRFEDEFGCDEADFDAEFPPHYEQILRFVQKYKWSNTKNQLVLLTRFCKVVLRWAGVDELDTAMVDIARILLGSTKEELKFLKSWLRHLEFDSMRDPSLGDLEEEGVRELRRGPIVRRLADLIAQQEEGCGTKFWEASLWKSPGSWSIAKALQDSLVRAGEDQYAKEFWRKMRRAWPKVPHLNYFYAESARNVADFKEAIKGWLEFVLSHRHRQQFPVETTLQSLQTALVFEYETKEIIDFWEKLLERCSQVGSETTYIQKCMAEAVLTALPRSSDQDTNFDLLVRVARLCPHDERIVAQLRVSEKLGDETQLWSSWLENGHDRVLIWYTVRLAQVCSFNARFAEAEAWIDRLGNGHDLDEVAIISIVAKIDVGCDPRIFWSRKVEGHNKRLAVNVLAEYSKDSHDFSWIFELARRRPWELYLGIQAGGLFRRVHPLEATSHGDEIEFWKDFVLSSPEGLVVEALAEAFRFHSSRPVVRNTLNDEIHLWYTMATQHETENTYGAIIEHLNDALVKKADDAVDEELSRTTWVWIDARNKWSCLKNRAWAYRDVTDQIQRYFDNACEVLQVLQAGEQETRTTVAQLGNFLLFFFDLSVRGSTSTMIYQIVSEGRRS